MGPPAGDNFHLLAFPIAFDLQAKAERRSQCKALATHGGNAAYVFFFHRNEIQGPKVFSCFIMFYLLHIQLCEDHTTPEQVSPFCGVAH